MRVARWRAAARIAARDARRSPGRSALVVTLLALPIFAFGAGDVLARTIQLSPAEKADRTLGAADALVQWVGGTVMQDAGANAWSSNVSSSTVHRPDTTTLLARLPTGTRTLAYARSQWTVRGAVGVRGIDVSDVAYRDPLVARLTRPISGRAPAQPGDIALTAPLARSLGVGLGGTIATLTPARTYRVVGIVADTYRTDRQLGYVLPGSLPASPADARSPVDRGWYVATAGPVRWPQVLALNSAGFLVRSRWVMQHPPAHSQMPIYQRGGLHSGTSAQTVSGLALLIGMVVLEIVLLAGPAFAVGARRTRRSLGLLAAVGGTRADLRNVVLGTGLVLGAGAGVLGAGAGVLVGLALLPVVGHVGHAVPGHVDLRPLELGPLVVISVLTGLLAAWLPARSAARTDVLAVLRGRRGEVRTSRRLPVLGALLAAAGALVAIGGGVAIRNPNVVLVGVIAVELGLIACTPTLLGAAGLLARRLPLSGRIALRDTARNRSAAAPAVAAIMAAVTGGVAAAIFVASSVADQRASYRPLLAANEAYAPGTPKGGSASDVAAALRRTLPAQRVTVLRGLPDVFGPVTGKTVVAIPVSRRGGFLRPGGLSGVVVSDGSDVDVIVGRSAPEAAAALRAGHAVIFDSALLDTAGQLTMQVHVGEGGPDVDHTVPATVVRSSFSGDTVVLPPAVAAAWRLPVSDLGFLVQNARAPTDHEVQRAQAALTGLGMTEALEVETGYHGDPQVALLILLAVTAVLTVGAASIATALSTVDSRADLVTLAAIGAAPRLRRRLAAARAGVVALLGCVLGVACGFLAPLGYLRVLAKHAADGTPGHHMPFTVPWLNLLATLVVVPAVAMACAYAFSRSRLPIERARPT